VFQVAARERRHRHGTASGALRVELPTDRHRVVGLAAARMWSARSTSPPRPRAAARPQPLGRLGGEHQHTSVKGSAGTLCSLTLISTSPPWPTCASTTARARRTCSSATGAKHSYPVRPRPAAAGVAVQLGPVRRALQQRHRLLHTGGGTDTDNTNARRRVCHAATK